MSGSRVFGEQLVFALTSVTSA